MAGVKKFEDLRMWQASRRLANLIYQLTGKSAFKDASLRNQIRRAAVSVMSNIAEGFGRGSNEEFQYFLYIAKGSLTEVLSQLYLSSDLNYISEKEFQTGQKLCAETASLLQAFAGKMKSANRTSFRKKRKVEDIAKEKDK
jgi:four helix bundle protein